MNIISKISIIIIGLLFSITSFAVYRSICYVTLYNDIKTPIYFYYYNQYYLLTHHRTHDFEVQCVGFDLAKARLMKKYSLHYLRDTKSNYFLISKNHLFIRASALRKAKVKLARNAEKNILRRCESKQLYGLYLPGLKFPSIHLYTCE